MFFNSKGEKIKRFNLSDIIITLVCLSIFIVLAYRFSSDNPNSPLKSAENIQTTFYIESLSDAYPIKEGDVVKDRNTNAVFGNVSNVIIDKSVDYGFDSEGICRVSSKPNYNSVTIVVEGKGSLSDTGVFFNNTQYYLNSSLPEFTVGSLPSFNVRIIAIEKL